MRDVRICRSISEVAEEAAREFCRIAESAVAAHGRFSVALSGGSTPKALYTRLGEAPWRSQIDWERTHLFWGDERWVPPDHAESNYRMVREVLLSKVEIPESNVHRVPTDLATPAEAAARYDSELHELFNLPASGAPRFDLVLLGLGEDGHTASLFPGTTAPTEDWRNVAPVWVERLHAHRITMTLPVINQAAHAVFLVTGASKAHIVGEILRGVHHPEKYPAQLVNPERGSLLWLLDEAAATALVG